MSTVFVILGYTIVLLFDMLALFKNGKKNEKIIYTSIFVISFLISILLSLSIDIPSAIPFYEKFILTLKQGVL